MDILSPALEERILELSRKPNVYEILAASLGTFNLWAFFVQVIIDYPSAPSIYEQEDVKKAVLLQLFGGTSKSSAKSESTKCRGNIHVLLCGDPAMSKSQILQYAHKLTPRGMYTSGKGSSAVGLTAYITRDPETKQLVLER